MVVVPHNEWDKNTAVLDIQYEETLRKEEVEQHSCNVDVARVDVPYTSIDEALVE